MKRARFARSFLFLFVTAIVGCSTEPTDEDVVDDQSEAQSAASADATDAVAARGWKIDARVLPQIGVFFGRNGSGELTPASRYQHIGQLSLPAGALTGNAIPLVDVQADDTAQIDFYRMDAERALGLGEMFRGYVGELRFDDAISKGLAPALVRQSILLKEVRLRGPSAPVLAPALSALSPNAFANFERVNYMSVFVTRPQPGSGAPAIEAFRASAANGTHAYEVGAIAPLPRIPHPQRADIALVGLMTVRLTDRLHGRRVVLEVIETE